MGCKDSKPEPEGVAVFRNGELTYGHFDLSEEEQAAHLRACQVFRQKRIHMENQDRKTFPSGMMGTHGTLSARYRFVSEAVV
jgi:hypothetical protein